MMEFEAGPSGKGWGTHWEGEHLVLVINRPEQARLSLMPHSPKVQLSVQLPPELTAILVAHESAVADCDCDAERDTPHDPECRSLTEARQRAAVDRRG